MRSTLKRLWREKSGDDTLEYALLIALIVLAAGFAIYTFGSANSKAYDRAEVVLKAATESGSSQASSGSGGSDQGGSGRGNQSGSGQSGSGGQNGRGGQGDGNQNGSGGQGGNIGKSTSKPVPIGQSGNGGSQGNGNSQ
jgi:Flp pilus assembly pilin Flp